jgi:hypothetical protein
VAKQLDFVRESLTHTAARIPKYDYTQFTIGSGSMSLANSR